MSLNAKNHKNSQTDFQNNSDQIRTKQSDKNEEIVCQSNSNKSSDEAIKIANSSNNGNNSSKQNKVERIREGINQCLSDKSKKKISGIINNVIELTDIEKVYLYLNLPNGSSQETEKLKPVSNPFGKKADIEVSQTYIWIQSHLEEDSTVSLPKAEVYEEYKLFCESNLSQPLCVADFGKAMKQIFPNIKPRRLGQRGNSRYCYSGLRKKVRFETPELPDLYAATEDKNESSISNDNNESSISNDNNELSILDSTSEQNNDHQLEQQISFQNDKNLVLSASSHIILEWAKKLFSLKLTSIKDLAKHLILFDHIDKESMAALTVIASEDNSNDELNFNQISNSNNSSILNKVDKKNFEIFRNKNRSDLTFKKLLEPTKKDKQIKKKADKEQLKFIVNKKNQSVETGKVVKSIKIKKAKIKKDKLRQIPTSKIKLESFDDLQTKFSFDTNNEKSLQLNSIEINKNQTESNNQFIDNTQLDLNQFSNQKRRHSTIGFEPIKTNQLNEDGIFVDDKRYDYVHQMKRQTSEHLSLSKKRLLNKLNGYHHNKPEITGNYFSNNQQSSNLNDLNLQSTNYLLNDLQASAKNNQLVCYKKYIDLNQTKSNENLELNNLDNNSKVASTDQLMNMQQIDTVNLNQTSISTQVDEQELYQINSNNNLFEIGNQATVNHQPINSFNPNMATNLINYNDVQSNMCNVNTQMPSVPASPINQKDNPFANQFTNQINNQMINEKVDFNNNLSSAFSYGDEQQIQLNNSQINNSLSNQLANQQLNNQLSQKLFLNPQQTKLVGNRTLNRVRHSSGPSGHPYNSIYNNSFLSNNNLNNNRSNSLSPLYEDQKMVNFNFNNHNTSTMMNKFSFEKNNYNISSNPVSPVSEPISPNFLAENKKQYANLRINKFTNLGQAKKDGSRSASFTSSNSNDPFVFAARTRHRHMSSPYIGTTMLPASGNNLNNYSYSSQSLTNSPTPFSSADLFASSTSLIDNTPVTPNHPINLNLQETNNFVPYNNKGAYELMNNKYELPLSPPLSGALNEEKTFKVLKREDLIKSNDQLAENQEWNNQQLPILLNMELQQNNNTCIQEFNNNLTTANSNLINRSIPTNEPVDDLQTTLQDLKDLEYI